jgi:hypothetical protein
MAGLVPAIHIFTNGTCSEPLDVQRRAGHDQFQMSPDLIFWLALTGKMAVAALFVVVATVTAERSGPTIGGLIATLPISAGPAYVSLALDHPPEFIAESALVSLAINAATAVYALIFVLLAQSERLIISFPAGLAVWLALSLTAREMEWTALTATLLNLVVFPICIVATQRFRHVRVPPTRLHASDLIVRAGMVALLVATVSALSFRIGPTGTGVLAPFPIVYTSIMVILHRRLGGPAAAAVIANGFFGLLGFGAALLTLHLTAVPLGSPAALSLALAVSLLWNAGLFAIGRYRASRAGAPA